MLEVSSGISTGKHWLKVDLSKLPWAVKALWFFRKLKNSAVLKNRHDKMSWDIKSKAVVMIVANFFICICTAIDVLCNSNSKVRVLGCFRVVLLTVTWNTKQKCIHVYPLCVQENRRMEILSISLFLNLCKILSWRTILCIVSLIRLFLSPSVLFFVSLEQSRCRVDSTIEVRVSVALLS